MYVIQVHKSEKNFIHAETIAKIELEIKLLAYLYASSEFVKHCNLFMLNCW